MLRSVLAVTVSLVASAAIGEVLRRVALRRNLLDRPNDRSLHTTPVPRVGGVALVLAFGLAVCLLEPRGEVRTLAWLSGAVAILGAADDMWALPTALRFGAHFLLAGVFVAMCGSFIANPVTQAPVLAAVLTAICLAGTLNIYNFMDGMDGLAGSHGVAIGATQATLFAIAGFGDGAAMAACLAAASAGFLVHNVPPARMFMGDAGSTFLGFAYSGLAILGSHHGIPVSCGLLPLAPLLLDGTFTIFRRALRSEKVWRAHRSHLYQRAVQTGLSHGKVLLFYLGWLAICCAATVVERRVTLAGWAVATLGLLVAIRWVRRLERRSQSARGS